MIPTFLIQVDAGIRILDKWQGTMGQNGDYPQQLAFPDISGEQFINGYRLLLLLTSPPSFTLHQIDLEEKIGGHNVHNKVKIKDMEDVPQVGKTNRRFEGQWGEGTPGNNRWVMWGISSAPPSLRRHHTEITKAFATWLVHSHREPKIFSGYLDWCLPCLLLMNYLLRCPKLNIYIK